MKEREYCFCKAKCERVRKCADSVSPNGEIEFLEDKSIYRQSLSCGQLETHGTKSKLWTYL